MLLSSGVARLVEAAAAGVAFIMTANSDFADVVAQIKAELSSVGRLVQGSTPGQGIAVIISPDLQAGWVGISNTDGSKAFGPAAEMLSLVQSYVRRVREDEKRSDAAGG